MSEGRDDVNVDTRKIGVGLTHQVHMSCGRTWQIYFSIMIEE